MKGNLFLHFGLIVFSSFQLHASDREELVFENDGHRVHLDEYHDELTVKTMKTQVYSPCAENAQLTCIKWKFVSTNPADEARYLPSLQSAIGFWNSITTSTVRFQYNGFSTTALNLPYKFKLDSKGNPTTDPDLDQFGNKILEGDFIISLAGAPLEPDSTPAFEFGSMSASQVIKYSRPEGDAEVARTVWAGIYLNPRFSIGDECIFDSGTQSGVYDLKAVVAHEIGRVLGLSPSGNNSSIMFPVCPMNDRPLALSNEDIRSLSSIYPIAGFNAGLGSLSGKVLRGEDGAPFTGAILHLVPIEHLTDLGRKWIVATAVSRRNGIFNFEALPPGGYLLIVEPAINAGLSHLDFDDTVKIFGTDDFFSMEFYDGKGRESNHEAALAFSPQSAVYAATLNIAPATNTSGVEMITNVGDESIEDRTAAGSTNEVLSQFTPAGSQIDLSKDNQQAKQYALKAGRAGLGGCQIASHSERNEMLLISTIITFLAALWIRFNYRRSKTRHSSRAVTRTGRIKRLEKFRIKFHRFNAPTPMHLGRPPKIR